MSTTTAAKYTAGQTVTLTQKRSGSHRAKGGTVEKQMEIIEAVWTDGLVIQGKTITEPGWTYRLRTPGTKANGKARYQEAELSA